MGTTCGWRAENVRETCGQRAARMQRLVRTVVVSEKILTYGNLARMELSIKLLSF